MMFPNADTAMCDVSSFDQLMAIACYVVWMAKETVDGCGGPTQLAVYDRKHSTITTVAAVASFIPQLEAAFKRLESHYAYVVRGLCEPTADNGSLDYFKGMAIRYIEPWRKWHLEMRNMFDDFKKGPSA